MGWRRRHAGPARDGPGDLLVLGPAAARSPRALDGGSGATLHARPPDGGGGAGSRVRRPGRGLAELRGGRSPVPPPGRQPEGSSSRPASAAPRGSGTRARAGRHGHVRALPGGDASGAPAPRRPAALRQRPRATRRAAAATRNAAGRWRASVRMRAPGRAVASGSSSGVAVEAGPRRPDPVRSRSRRRRPATTMTPRRARLCAGPVRVRIATAGRDAAGAQRKVPSPCHAAPRGRAGSRRSRAIDPARACAGPRSSPPSARLARAGDARADDRGGDGRRAAELLARHAPRSTPRRIERVRDAAGRAGRQVAILQDLPGPKLRIGDAARRRRRARPGRPRDVRLRRRGGRGRQARACTISWAGPGRGARRPDEVMYLADGAVRLRVDRTSAETASSTPSSRSAARWPRARA